MALKLSPTRTIIRGDSDKIRLTFTKKVSDEPKTGHKGCSCLYGLNTGKKEKTYPIDITGWEINFTVRATVPDSSITSDSDALISQKGTILDAENGIAMVYVPSETTTVLLPGIYFYDIQVIKPFDEYGYRQVSSIRRGKYVVIGDITRDEKLYPSEDIEFIWEEGDNVKVINAISGYNNEKLLISNVRVVSDVDGNIVLDKLLQTRNTTIRQSEAIDEDADDGYTI